MKQIIDILLAHLFISPALKKQYSINDYAPGNELWVLSRQIPEALIQQVSELTTEYQVEQFLRIAQRDGLLNNLCRYVNDNVSLPENSNSVRFRKIK